MAERVITCPDCSTSFRTTDSAIGPNGRTVRCARCRSTWFVPAEGSVAGPDADALALQNDLMDEGGALTPPAPPAGRITPPAPVGPATSVPARAPTADVLLRDRADAQRLGARRRTIRIIWIVAALLALAAVVVAFLNRQAIVNRQPETASLFRALGMEVRAGGLEIDPPTVKTTRVDGQVVLRVDGAVRNLSAEPKAVPLIAMTLHDANGAALAQWFVEPDTPRLAARGRMPFATDYPDPPEGATGLRYAFSE